MSIWLVLVIAVALAMDAFAVALGLAISRKGLTSPQVFRLAFHFGLFQFLMPIAGWFAGKTFLPLIERYDHWVAFALLLGVGGKMIRESLGRRPEAEAGSDPTRGLTLVVLAVATSIDALAVGLSLAALQSGILFPASVIGMACFLLTTFGARVGPLLGRLVGKRAEMMGGVILVLIGIKILTEHLR